MEITTTPEGTKEKADNLGSLIPWIKPAIDDLIARADEFTEATLNDGIRAMLGNPNFEGIHDIQEREECETALKGFIEALYLYIDTPQKTKAKRSDRMEEKLVFAAPEFGNVLRMFVRERLKGRVRCGNEIPNRAFDAGDIDRGAIQQIADMMTASETNQDDLDDFVRMKFPNIIRIIRETREAATARLEENATRTGTPSTTELLQGEW